MDHPVVVLFVVIAVVASMGLAAEVLKPLSLAVLLAFALTPFAKFFENRGLPRVAAVVFTILITLGGLAGISYVVVGQLNHLAGDLTQPAKRQVIDQKLRMFRGPGGGNFEKVQSTLQELASSFDQEAADSDAAPRSDDPAGPPIAGKITLAGEKIPKVEVVAAPKFRERLQEAIGPFLETLTLGSFILILVLFMMVGRDDLGDRIVALFGGKRLSMTSRTMHEVGNRIGRYLATNALVNAGFGLVIGSGLALIGLPYAVLWGVLAALLRFIPYVGTVVSFALPTVYAVVSYTGWGHALAVVVLFLVVETALNSFLEPIIYGKTTGVSALGLLVAAMFWTWLWGIWGLLLSTPMTVALAVLGKYISALRFFSIILGEEAELDPDVRYYQRLLALDEDGAEQLVEEFAKSRPRIEVFDLVLLPALARAERDLAAGEIDETTQAFAWRVTEDLVDGLSNVPTIEFAASAVDGADETEPVTVIGVSVEDRSDRLALRMLAQVLDSTKVQLEIPEEGQTPLALADSIAADGASMVFVSHVPPTGLTSARYIVRRLRARLGDLPIIVGRWHESAGTKGAGDRIMSAGATEVVSTLAEARDRLQTALSKPATPPPLSPLKA